MFSPLFPGGNEPFPKLRFVQDSLQLFPESIPVSFREHQTRIADHVRNGAGIRADDWNTCRHGFNQNAPELLFPCTGCPGRQDQTIESSEDTGNLFRRYALLNGNSGSEPLLVNQPLVIYSIGTVAGKGKPDMFGKAWYVGTGKDTGAQPYKFLHEVMKERPGHVAKLKWVNSASHDVHGIMSVYENGFIIQEITPEYIHKPFSSVEIKDAEVPGRLIEKGVKMLDEMVGEFDHSAIVDDYPEAVDKLTGMKAMGEEIPVEELPAKKQELGDLEAMLE